MLQKYHQVNHPVNFNSCLVWFWYVHLVHLHVYSTAHKICMTSHIIFTYIQHQPTNLYCMGINSLAMVYCMVQKQNKCSPRVYIPQLQIGAKYIFYIRYNTRQAQLDSTHRWCFWTNRWSVLSPGDPPAYLFTSIPCKIQAWTLKSGHRYLTTAVWPSLLFMPTENLEQKKNKWMGHAYTVKGVISYNGSLRKLY